MILLWINEKGSVFGKTGFRKARGWLARPDADGRLSTSWGSCAQIRQLLTDTWSANAEMLVLLMVERLRQRWTSAAPRSSCENVRQKVGGLWCIALPMF